MLLTNLVLQGNGSDISTARGDQASAIGLVSNDRGETTVIGTHMTIYKVKWTWLHWPKKE